MLSCKVSAVTASNFSSSYFSRAKACTSGIAESTSVMREATLPSCRFCFLTEALVLRYRWNRLKHRNGIVASGIRPTFQFRANMMANIPRTSKAWEENFKIDSAKTSFRVFVSPAILVIRSPDRA